MDKYQKLIFSQGSYNCFHDNCLSEKTKQPSKCIFEENTDTYTVYQEDDIFSTVYSFEFYGYVKYVFVKEDKKEWIKIAPINGSCNLEKYYSIKLDFDKRINQIKFVFNDNLANPYILNVQYVEADKESYYKQKAEEQRQQLIKNASIYTRTGDNLVNIYFQPCDENFSSCEIDLFADVGDFRHCVPQKLAKYKADKDVYFIAVSDLAEGKYLYRLRQLDSENNVLFETDYINFSIQTPDTGLKGLVIS